MGSNDTRPQGQNLDIRPDEFIPQRIRPCFLRGFVRVIYRFAGKWRDFQARDRGDVQDCAGLAGDHASVENGVRDEHGSVDVCGDHCLDFVDLQLVEGAWRAECETGLFWLELF